MNILYDSWRTLNSVNHFFYLIKEQLLIFMFTDTFKYLCVFGQGREQ